MSTELAQAGTQLAHVVADVTADVHLIARNAEEMKSATSSMAEWFRQKEDIAIKDAAELQAALNVAIDEGWRLDSLKRQVKIAKDRCRFYEKCRLAAEAGYCIVPNIPATLFAIRTTKWHPRWQARWPGELTQRSEAPPAGEGEYFDADPICVTRSGPGSKPGETITFTTAEEFAEIEFPISVARPSVMTATAEAMAMKVFDELAVCVGGSDPLTQDSQRSDRKRKGDPLVLGIVRKPGRSTWNDSRVTFLIAWHVNTADI